ncbi:MAG: helix-turn-helix domain-containing protein, partial [Mesorhizobium sp.]
RRLLLQALRELDEARGWMMTVGRKTAAEKVASFMLLIARNIDPTLDGEGAPAAAFDLPLTRADIGDFLGLTIETVSRQLTRLGRDGLISVKGRRVELLDMGRLADLAGA